MLSRIRRILTIRQLLTLAVVALIAPFWIINFEEWLKTRKFDRVLIETDEAITEPGFWGSVMDLLDPIVRLANSDYVIGAVVAVLIYAFAPLPLKLWRYLRGQANDAAPVEVKEPAHPAVVPQERTRPKTSAYDLPIKLSVIDQLLAIVGSKKELEQTVRTGHWVFRDWDKKIKAGGIRNLFDDLEEYRDKFSALQDKVESIRKDNEKYEDIHEIVDFGNRQNVIIALNRLMAVLHHLGPTPPTKFAFFVEPSTKDLSSILVEFESWRFEAEKALLARRKELSG